MKPNSYFWHESRLPTRLLSIWHPLTFCAWACILFHLCSSCRCPIFLSVGQWNATGMVLVGRNLTTLPWTLGVSVRRLTRPRGWDPRLLTRLPSSPRAALHTCGARTRTRTWRQSLCLDSQERSASRCEAGWCGNATSLVIRPKDQRKQETGLTRTLLKLSFDSKKTLST